VEGDSDGETWTDLRYPCVPCLRRLCSTGEIFYGVSRGIVLKVVVRWRFVLMILSPPVRFGRTNARAARRPGSPVTRGHRCSRGRPGCDCAPGAW
jgi:hypothetical protein